VYAGEPARTAAFAQLLKGVRLAGDWALEQPLVVPISVADPPPRFMGRGDHLYDDDGRTRCTAVLLIGPLQAIYPESLHNLPMLGCFPFWLGPHAEVWGSTGVVAGEREDIEPLAAWRPQPLTRDGLFVVSHPAGPNLLPAHVLYPDRCESNFMLWSPYQELADFIARTHQEQVQPGATVGGLYLVGDQQDQVRQQLDDPRVIQLARDLRQASPRQRAAIRRAALTDDDPHLADFAAWDLVVSQGRDEEPKHAPVELLRAWPHRAGAGNVATQAGPVTNVFERMSPEAAAREIRELGRTCVDADRLGPILSACLAGGAGPAHLAAQEVFLARLPRDGLPRKWESWPWLEREKFAIELVDRLHVEFAQGDRRRAFDAARSALNLVGGSFLSDTCPACSQLHELAGNLLFDPEFGASIRQADGSSYSYQVRMLAARECLRRSDPELRMAACRILLKDGGLVPREYEGDPWLRPLLLKGVPE
jgi:hypothetical protein